MTKFETAGRVTLDLLLVDKVKKFPIKLKGIEI